MNPRRAEALLTRWVNLPDPQGNNKKRLAAALVMAFPEVFAELREPGARAVDERDFYRSVWGIREHLRAVWKARDERDRQWLIFRLRQLHDQHLRELAAPHMRALEDDAAAGARPDDSLTAFFVPNFREMIFWGMLPEGAPPPRPFEQAMWWFQRNAGYARYCPNPDCPAPYFFSRRNKYCGRKRCLRYSQAQARRRWWRAHGNEWRAGLLTHKGPSNRKNRGGGRKR